jgi:hypothetical protein
VRDVERSLRFGRATPRPGEFAPGFPFAYMADPVGYEIWFE